MDGFRGSHNRELVFPKLVEEMHVEREE